MNNQEVLRAPCPSCGKVGFIQLCERAESIKVKGQTFGVKVESFVCSECECEFEAGNGVDSLDLAYRMYRDANGLLQPEKLKAWRTNLGLKQAELALLLGWSTATVSRYENGALQDEAHDRAMQAAMTNEGLARLLDVSKSLPDELVGRLRARVRENEGTDEHFAAVLASRLSKKGAQPVNWKKISETVVWLCQGKGAWRTKLNKLLFYSDFLHTKHFGRSITGLPYVRLQHGPVPEEYELIFATLKLSGDIGIHEMVNGEKLSYLHRAKRAPKVEVFSRSEIQVLIRVQDEFERTSATELSDRSHQEDAWRQTKHLDPVSFGHAKSLSLSL